MKKSEKKRIFKLTEKIYDKEGQSGVFDFVKQYCKQNEVEIPYENCRPCETESPSIDHICLVCGQETTAIPKITKSTYDITIKGGGTTAKIKEALRGVIKSIERAEKSKDVESELDGAEWEDETLMTEISLE